MQTDSKLKPSIGADNNALIALLSINLVVYAIIGFLKVVYYLNGYPLEEFYTQIMSPSILYASKEQLIHQPWTLFTYSWVHDGFWVLLTNMIWLSAFGFLLQQQAANKHIFPIYFYAGILAGLIYIFIGAPLPLMGAQVGVIAIAMAALSLNANYRLLKNIGTGLPAWILVLIYLVLQAFSLQETRMSLIISYLVAGVIGFTYILLLKKGKDLGKWMHQLVHLLNNSLAPKNK